MVWVDGGGGEGKWWCICGFGGEGVVGWGEG